MPPFDEERDSLERLLPSQQREIRAFLDKARSRPWWFSFSTYLIAIPLLIVGGAVLIWLSSNRSNKRQNEISCDKCKVHQAERDGQSPSANRFESTGQFGDSFGVITSVLSGLALLGAVAAVLGEREARKQSDRVRILEFFRDWDGERMDVIKKLAWSARTNWFRHPSYKRVQIDVTFEHDKLYDEWEERYPELYREMMKERSAIWSLAEFYWMVSQLPPQLSPMMAEWAFNYTWYRGFLYEWFVARDRRYWGVLARHFQIDDLPHCKLCKAVRQFPPEPYLASLRKLDKMFGLKDEYDVDYHLIDGTDGERIVVPTDLTNLESRYEPVSRLTDEERGDVIDKTTIHSLEPYLQRLDQLRLQREKRKRQTSDIQRVKIVGLEV